MSFSGYSNNLRLLHGAVRQGKDWCGLVRLCWAWLGLNELLRLLTNNLRLSHGPTWQGKEWQGEAWRSKVGQGWARAGFGGLPNNNPSLIHNKGE